MHRASQYFSRGFRLQLDGKFYLWQLSHQTFSQHSQPEAAVLHSSVKLISTAESILESFPNWEVGIP